MPKPIVDTPVKTMPSVTDKTGFLLDATKKANAAYTYHQDNFLNAEQNLAYIYGEQYTQQELNDKAEMNRIALTFNKLPQFINKVTGMQRSTVHTIVISPAGSSAALGESKLVTASGKERITSEVYTDITRNIEYESNAKAWYKMAFKHSLEGGFGYLRVLTEYQDEGFEQDIRIRGIRNRWSVLIDPTAQESDASDMKYCFVNESITRKEFEKRYPDKSYEAMPGATEAEGNTFWNSEDMVTVSEYFWREPIKRTIALGSDGQTYNYDEIEDKLVQMAEEGIELIKFREVDTHKVMWAKISQGDILDGPRQFPTTTIPIVPVYGRQYDFRNKMLLRGLVDDALDAQTALNKMRSSALERIDSSPITPFVATDKAIEGYEDQWAEANSVKYSTLIYRKGEERPTREMGATMPTAELQTSQFLDEDMKASIGIFNASLGNKSNEISGRAIEARKQEADIGTFEFFDNYNNAIRRVGLLVTELIPIIYDTDRVIQLRMADGKTDSVRVNAQTPNGVANQLRSQKYTVNVSSGASYETRQQENASQILELMKVNQSVAQVGSDLLVKNLDFADSDTLAERLEKTIPPQFMSKEKREEIQKDSPPPEPSPEEKAAQLEAQTKEMELKAKQQESQIKLEIEKIKLEQAKVNLQTKQVESQMTINREQVKSQDQDQKRKDEVAKSIVEQMKGKENASTKSE